MSIKTVKSIMIISTFCMAMAGPSLAAPILAPQIKVVIVKETPIVHTARKQVVVHNHHAHVTTVRTAPTPVIVRKTIVVSAPTKTTKIVKAKVHRALHKHQNESH